MKGPTFAGLIKFFRNEAHLDALIDGLLYCNTPEFYRKSTQLGIGDAYESCVRSFRGLPGDERAKLFIDGQLVAHLHNLTEHRGGVKDMWLHCWCALDIPDEESEFVQLVADVNRLRDEFGEHYAVIPRNRLKDFSETLQALTTLAFRDGRVRYSDEQESWSVGCKATKYAYQREYRFAFGQCEPTSTEPLELRYPSGFANLVQKNPVIEMSHNVKRLVCFLDQKGCSLRQLA